MLAEIAKQKNPFLELHLTPMQVSFSFHDIIVYRFSFDHVNTFPCEIDTAHVTCKSLSYCEAWPQ